MAPPIILAAIEAAGARLLGAAARRLAGPGLKGVSAARRDIRKGSVAAGRRAYKKEQRIARQEATALGLKGDNRRRYVAERAQEAREATKAEFAGIIDSVDSYIEGLPEAVAKKAVGQLDRGNINAAAEVLDKFAATSITREKSNQRTRLLDGNIAGAIKGGATAAEKRDFLQALARGSSVTEAARAQAAKAATISYADVDKTGPEAFRALTQAREFNRTINRYSNITSLTKTLQNRLMREAGLTRDNAGVWRDEHGIIWTPQDVESHYKDVTPIETERTFIYMRDTGKGDTDHADVYQSANDTIKSRAVRSDRGARLNITQSLLSANFNVDFPGIYDLIMDKLINATAAEVKEWHNSEVFKKTDGKSGAMYSSDRETIRLNLHKILDTFGIPYTDIPAEELDLMPPQIKYDPSMFD